VIAYSIWGCFYYNKTIEGSGKIVSKYSYSPDYMDFDGEHYFKVRLEHKGESLYRGVYVSKSWWETAKIGDSCYVKELRWMYNNGNDENIFIFIIPLIHVLGCIYTIITLIAILVTYIPKIHKFLDKDIELFNN
jgi:hypothetical protein